MRATTMLDSRRALVDTSAFYALSHDREVHHRAASEIARRLRVERWLLVTTNFLVAEAHALHLNRLGRDPARAFLAGVDGGGMTVVRVTEDDERQGRAIIDRFVDKSFSLVDATSFAVMERLDIPYAFTFDRHFEQYGLAQLRP